MLMSALVALVDLFMILLISSSVYHDFYKHGYNASANECIISVGSGGINIPETVNRLDWNNNSISI